MSQPTGAQVAPPPGQIEASPSAPDRAEIERRGRAAIVELIERRTIRPCDLTMLALLRSHDVLGETNNLVLPPLFTLLCIDLLFGVELGEARLLWHMFGALFFMEWLAGLVVAKERLAYLKDPWLVADLLSSLPLATAFQALRLSRLTRVVRLTKLLHLLRARRFGFPWGKVLRAFGVTLSISTSGAVALFAVEPQTVARWEDALWWSTVTMTTVGYGDISPQTTSGRLIAVVLMLTSVGVFSYLAGLMATALFDPEEEEILDNLVRVEAKLDRILDSLERTGGPVCAPTDLE